MERKYDLISLVMLNFILRQFGINDIVNNTLLIFFLISVDLLPTFSIVNPKQSKSVLEV